MDLLNSDTYTSFAQQYPTQSNSGRRELRAMENRPSSSKSKPTTPSDIPNEPYFPSSDAVNETSSEDFQYRERTRIEPSEAGTPLTETPVSPIDDPQPSRQRHHEHNYSRDEVYHAASRDYSHHDSRYLSTQDRHTPRARSALSHRPSGRSRRNSVPDTSDTLTERGFGPGDRSSKESIRSQESAATSVHTLPPLQTKAPDNSDAQQLEPIGEDDPRSWDLVDPPEQNESQPTGIYALEKRAEQLFSSEHLHTIFDDPKLLLKFTGFLNHHRPKSIPVLIYYLDALKALRAIGYANAIAEALDPIVGQDFTQEVARPTQNNELEQKAGQAFEILVREDLPAYIAHEWVRLVSVSIQRRITGTLAPHLREASEGLAEVFCLTDPSRTDNPIVFASEEFARTTQYGMGYTIGRNCRFLQGPRTSPHSVRRLKQACVAGKEHTELFVNYRRDGSPFMNLLMIAPLMDSKGKVRYYIGAQVDVSGLLRDCANMDGLVQLTEKDENLDAEGADAKKDEFQQLTEMFNGAELDIVRRCGGKMHKEYVDDTGRDASQHRGRRLLLKDQTQDADDRDRADGANGIPPAVKDRLNGKLQGVYEHVSPPSTLPLLIPPHPTNSNESQYLLIRPAPSLRILFTSPSLRVPGILQSPFLARIGGSSRVRADLSAALAEGRGVTAKIRWLAKADEDGDGEGRPRWIHCTPLLGHSGAVGVWMIVLVDEEGGVGGAAGGSGWQGAGGKRFRNAPPVASNINGKEWDAGYAREKEKERKRLNGYEVEELRRGGGGGGGGAPRERENYPYHGISRDHSYVAQRPGGRRDRSTSGYSHSSGQQFVRSADTSEFSFQLK